MFSLGLQNKVALVTGGSDGLGRATAERLAEEGCKVVICGRREAHLGGVANSIASASGSEVVAIAADVSKSDDIDALVDATVGRFNTIDILVNNAGTSAAAGFSDVTDEVWQYDFDLKLMAAVRLCRRVLPLMTKQGGGAIVNAVTVGGKTPQPRALPTSVSRAAGLNLTKSLASEYAQYNVRVNAVCIGLLKSAQWERRAGEGGVDQLYSEMAKRIPLGRVGDSQAYADLVAFLVSERADYITGTAVNLDGGMSSVV